MKINLSNKIILIIFSLSIFLFLGISHFSIYGQKEDLIELFVERAKSTIYSIETNIHTKEDILDKEKLLLIIQKNLWLDPEIKNISFNLPENDKLITYVSNNQNFFNKDLDLDNINAFKKNILIDKTLDVDGFDILRIIKPINISGKLVGTIQIDFTLDGINKRIADAMSKLFITFFSFLIIFLIFFYYFIRLIILKPILKINNGLKEISKNNLNYHIEIRSKDEIGDLSRTFNTMVKFVKISRADVDKKVEEQTKEINKKIKEADDQNKAILNILEDVEREKKKVEDLANDLEKFKLAVENASDQIVITDIDGIVIYGNKAVEKITGFKPEEALGKKAGALWKVPMQKDYYENLWDIIKNKKETFVSEIQNKRKNGEIYTALISISSVFDKDDNIIYFVAIERDITIEKEIDKAKTEFVSLASHQLRTPLSAINWYTEMLLAGDAGEINEEERKYLNEIAVGNKRMVDLVDDLLNVSRLDMGTFIIENKSIDLFGLIKDVLKEEKSKILEKDLKIEESYCIFDFEFFADEKLLRMIFENLVSNAIKYTPKSGFVKINISVNNDGDVIAGKMLNEKSLVFSVSDNGMGIPLSDREKIFAKLFRANNAKESETEGTGLGLYVIKSITDQAGGSVWFVSEEDKGSTFYVSFPINGMKMKEKKKLG